MSRAVDERLQSDVAVKVLQPGATQQEEFLERFRTEARNCAALQQPNIVTICHPSSCKDSRCSTKRRLLARGGRVRAADGLPPFQRRVGRFKRPCACRTAGAGFA